MLVDSPVSTLLLVAMVLLSLIALYGRPSLIERGVFRPFCEEVAEALPGGDGA